MSGELLLLHFDRVAESPNATATLRRFLVDLAVSGRLAPSSDGPSEWTYARLGNVVDLKYGKGLAPTDRAPKGPVAVYGSNGVVARTQTALSHAPAIIVGRKGSAGALRIAEEPSWTTDVAYYIEPPPSFDIRFLFFALQSLRLETLGKGVKPGLSRSDAYPLLLPQPPVATQRRVVAMVDELMALCDELEAAQRHREARRDRLRSTALRTLGATYSPAPEASARFFLTSSSRMVTKPEHVPQVRQAILDLAVKGRLVTQRQTDTPARTALIEADGTRAKIAHSDRRAASGQQPLLAADLRWDVPAGWEWRGLADLVLFIDYRGRTPSKTTSGIRLVTAKNVRPGRLSPQPEEFISPEEYTRWMTRGLPKPGDVLFTTEAPMGNAAVVRDEEPFGLAQRVIDLRSYGAIDPDFLALQLAAAPFQAVLDATATGLTAKGIKAAKLKRLPIVVPPLEEQGRIVAKVTELMGVCDEMELHLTEVLGLRLRVSEAAIRNASLAGTEVLVDAV